MDFDVTIDRDKYIGGSDVPIIMGISPFKTRYQLLLEKAGIEENTFIGNEYTRYGDILEPQIREHINIIKATNFEPSQKIVGDIRCHTDGFNGDTVLEIKTTSRLHNNVNEYKMYLCQLLLYMSINNVKNGLLAVYSRPSDFNEVFDSSRLTTYDINIDDYKDLVDKIYFEIDRFLKDLTKIKENPLLTEEDLQPTEVVEVTNRVIVLERKMAEFKEIEKQYKKLKDELFNAMESNGIPKWEMFNGTKITLVATTPSTTTVTTEFNLDKFKVENPEIYEKYLEEVEKTSGGKKGYIKIILPKKAS